MKLTKIRLINWHQFWDNEIEIKNNTLLTGENGSGKSTLLDAIFFVLSGGESKMFNKAANNESGRTIESYMRCKTGVEGQACLRNTPDLISHIALEFQNSRKSGSFVIGCVLEIHGAADPKTKFYVLENKTVSDMVFVDGREIVGSDQMKKMYGNSLFSDMNKSRRMNRQNIVKLLGLNRNADQKYYDLLCKAIAFDPIKGNVSQFVNEFLLKENNVNIDSLQNELRNYREINDNIAREKAKKEQLDTFIEKAKRYQENLRVIQYLNILKYDSDIEESKREIDRLTIEISKRNDENKGLKDSIDRNASQREKDVIRRSDLEKDDLVKALNSAKDQLAGAKRNYEDAAANAAKWESIFTKEYSTVQALGFSFDFKRAVREKNFPLLNSHIRDYIRSKDEKDSTLRTKNAELTVDLGHHKNDLSKINRGLEKLNSNLKNYPDGLTDIIAEIRSSISKKYSVNPDDIIILPLCECLEMVDPEWTNATEGYLNTQRFDLIVSPEYFIDAVAVTERHKDLRFGIIDVKSAKGNVSEGSLYEKVSVVNDLADGIIRCLLGNVICVDSISDLSKYRVAITKSCVIYRNYTARNLNKKAYDIPYIGKGSIIRQIEILESQKDDLEHKVEKINRSISDNRYLLGLIQSSAIKEEVKEDYWNKKESYSAEIKKLEQHIEKMESSEDLFSILNEIELLKAEIERLKDEEGKLQDSIVANERKIGSFSARIDDLNAQLSDISCKRNELFDSVKDKIDFEESTRKYYSEKDGDILKSTVQRELESRNNYNSSAYQSIIRGMTDYANNYSKGLFARIECISDYIAEYNKLMQDDIPALQSKAEKIYRDTQRDFNDNFISVIRQKIEEGKNEIKNINKNLKSHPFGKSAETYEFITNDSLDQEMREYYRIIKSGKEMEQRDFITEQLDAKDRDIINRLFSKLSGSDSNQEADISKYLDYRNYLSYDIKITYGNGETALFSKIHKEKSGGETQTPFYVIMGSCFDELINKRENSESSCLVVFDEAFNNMDEIRIQSLMGFYQELDLQVLIVVPSNRCHNLMPYVDSVIALIQNNNSVEIHELTNEGA